VPYRLSGSTASLFDVSTSLRSSGSRRPRLLSKAVHPLPGFEPSSETPFECRPGLLRRRTVAALQGSSPEVSRPFSGHKFGESAYRPVPPGTPSLFDLSQVLEGFVLAEPRRLVSSCCRSWGSSPSELFPADELSQAHHLAIPSRRFVPRPVVGGRAPRGFRRSAIRHPTQECCILRQAAALLGFHPLSRRSCISGSSRLSTSHPLLAFASLSYETFSKLAFSVFDP
jgi:hypothetical protein